MSSNNMWRASVIIPKELETAIIALRKTDEFSRCSISEIVRVLITKGLKESDKPV